MGMAASQARFLGLTARKTNTEYEGQQVNQQRTALANQSADLYNRLLTLEVPSPPDITNYYKTTYTYQKVDGSSTNDYEIISGLGSSSCVVQKTATNDVYTLNTGYAKSTTFIYPKTTTSGDTWYISFNSKSQEEKAITEMKSASGDENQASVDVIKKIMNDLYDNATKDPLNPSQPADLSSTGVGKGFIIADLDTTTGEYSNYRELTYKDMLKCREEYEKAKATGLYSEDELVKIKNAWADDLVFNDADISKILDPSATETLSSDQRNKMYYFTSTDSKGTSTTQYVQATYLGANAKGQLELKSSEEQIIKEGIAETYYDRQYKEYSQITYNNCSWVSDTSGRPCQFTGVNADTGVSEGPYDLTITTVKDETAYNQAMNDYTYKKNLYDKEVADINAKTESIQAQDRTLELRLKQLDTEQKALQNEMEAVAKVIKTNVEKTFKTFAE